MLPLFEWPKFSMFKHQQPNFGFQQLKVAEVSLFQFTDAPTNMYDYTLPFSITIVNSSRLCSLGPVEFSKTEVDFGLFENLIFRPSIFRQMVDVFQVSWMTQQFFLEIFSNLQKKEKNCLELRVI